MLFCKDIKMSLMKNLSVISIIWTIHQSRCGFPYAYGLTHYWRYLEHRYISLNKLCIHFSVTKKSPMKSCCKRCGQDIYETQTFCEYCGYKIGDVCLGKINGNPCTKSINSEIRFCSDCGTTKPDYVIGNLSLIEVLHYNTALFNY